MLTALATSLFDTNNVQNTIGKFDADHETVGIERTSCN